MHIGMSLQTVTIVMKDSNKLECYITKKGTLTYDRRAREGLRRRQHLAET